MIYKIYPHFIVELITQEGNKEGDAKLLGVFDKKKMESLFPQLKERHRLSSWIIAEETVCIAMDRDMIARIRIGYASRRLHYSYRLWIAGRTRPLLYSYDEKKNCFDIY